MEARDFGKRALQRVKNNEKGQNSYLLLLTIKNVFQHYIFSSLHQCIYMTQCLYIFCYICTEMHAFKSSVFVLRKGMYTLINDGIKEYLITVVLNVQNIGKCLSFNVSSVAGFD
jgi:hypothetical protein